MSFSPDAVAERVLIAEINSALDKARDDIGALGRINFGSKGKEDFVNMRSLLSDFETNSLSFMPERPRSASEPPPTVPRKMSKLPRTIQDVLMRYKALMDLQKLMLLDKKERIVDGKFVDLDRIRRMLAKAKDELYRDHNTLFKVKAGKTEYIESKEDTKQAFAELVAADKAEKNTESKLAERHKKRQVQGALLSAALRGDRKEFTEIFEQQNKEQERKLEQELENELELEDELEIDDENEISERDLVQEQPGKRRAPKAESSDWDEKAENEDISLEQGQDISDDTKRRAEDVADEFAELDELEDFPEEESLGQKQAEANQLESDKPGKTLIFDQIDQRPVEPKSAVKAKPNPDSPKVGPHSPRAG
jgi:hypothetical protein